MRALAGLGECVPALVSCTRDSGDQARQRLDLEQTGTIPIRYLFTKPTCSLCWAQRSRYLTKVAGVAQLVEQLTCNEKVEGSIPFSGTNDFKHLGQSFGVGLFVFQAVYPLCTPRTSTSCQTSRLGSLCTAARPL